jgi:replicative DNA helicase
VTQADTYQPGAEFDAESAHAMPRAVPAEQIVLGSMMLSARAADEVIEVLTTRDFYDPRHATVYAVLVAQLAADQPTEPVALAHALDGLGKLGTGAGRVPLDYLHTLYASPPTAATAGHYARIVAGKAVLRRLVEAGTRIMQIGYGAEGAGRDPADAVDLAQRTLHEATAANQHTDLGPVAEWTTAVVDHLEAVVEGRAPRGVSSGMGSLDKLVGGWLPGQLVIPAGRPGAGKSAAALGFAKAAARRGLPTFVFSVEMSKGELMCRLFADVASIDLAKFTQSRLDRPDLAKIRDAQKIIDGWPLHIYDTFRTMPMIRAAARRLTQRFGTPGLIVVDYLQRIESDRRHDRRDLEVGAIARQLKTLAQELGTTVIAPAQVNRGSETRTDKRPQLSDLRDSGELEQEADIVILIHRDDLHDPECERAGEADLIVAKHRNGPRDTVTVAAQLHYSRFADWDTPEEPYR